MTAQPWSLHSAVAAPGSAMLHVYDPVPTASMFDANGVLTYHVMVP
jgi:hypothetical protein